MPLKHSVEEIKLANGAKGLFIYAPDTTAVRYDVYFRAGNHYAKTPEISQVAHIMEHMSFGPNAKFETTEEFSQEFSRNGAYSNAWTASTGMSYRADSALMEWDRILDLQKLAITTAKYRQRELDSEKGNVKEEIIGYANNYGRVLWQQIMRRAGIKRWFDEEELATIPNVTLDDIREHYKRTHALNNMYFVFAGDLKPHRDEIISNLESWSLSKGKLLPIKEDSAHSTGLVHVKREELKNLTFQIYFFLNRDLSRREVRAMNVLSHILTGTLHSRIWGEARSRGICYGMGSGSNSQVSGISDFSLGGQVSFDNAPELLELIADRLQKVVAEGVTEQELSAAKEYRLGSMQLSTQTVSSLVDWYEDYYYDYGIIDRVEDMPKMIEATTCEEIQGLVKEFIESKHWSFGGIGNIEESELSAHYQKFAEALGKS